MAKTSKLAITVVTRVVIAAGVLSWGCTPLRDLDHAASGQGGASGGTTDAGRGGGGGMAGGGAGAAGAADGAGPIRAGGVDGAWATGGSAASGGLASGGMSGAGGTVAIDAAAVPDGAAGAGGIPVDSGGTTTSTAGAAGGGGNPDGNGPGGATGGIAPDLPDIYDSPVQGEITYSAGASWDIDGTQWPAFEIHTPTASYFLVKSAAAIVSINDSSGLQWINFSSGFRPNRGVPNLGGCCQPGDPAKLGLPTMTTVLDPSFTVTSSHLRLISKSDDSSYWLVWDFFLTHFTLTINRAATPFGFTYRGVPGGALDSADQLVLSNGVARSASTPYNGDLPGPCEWAYLAHPLTGQSLFLIQHGDDSLAETYQIADGDSAMFVFGSGQMTQTPIRFSLGLVNSCDDQVVRDRIAFVENAIH